MRVVRIWFSKTGLSRYISHLDLMRTMTRAIRRSRISLWYTEGFNPHPYMAFALPLSLGMESENECMDIRIESDATNEELFAAIAPVMPGELRVTAVTDPVIDPKFIAFAYFDIVFDAEDLNGLEQHINELLSADELIVQKLGKKGHRKVFKDVNLMEYINEYTIQSSFNSLTLSLILPAGSVTNINPDLLATKIAEGHDVSYLIKRKQLLTAQMEEFR